MVVKDREDKAPGVSALLGAFGGAAPLLASLGLYRVMGYAVARRTREMASGLRSAPAPLN
jgi:hypothetical protein